MQKIFLISLICYGVISCNSDKNAEYLVSILNSKSATEVTGTIYFYPTASGVTIEGQGENLPPNTIHGLHIHEFGNCNSQDAKTAGGHFSPENNVHGGPNSPEHHAGDLGNITADHLGIATIKKFTPMLSIDHNNKFSIKNKTIIVHAKADDLKTGPSGSAGKRIACGIIKHP